MKHQRTLFAAGVIGPRRTEARVMSTTAVLNDTPVDQRHRIDVSMEAYQAAMGAEDDTAADLDRLRRIRDLAADLMRLDAAKHRAITTGTGAELQEAADRYARTWQALKQEVAA